MVGGSLWNYAAQVLLTTYASVLHFPSRARLADLLGELLGGM